MRLRASSWYLNFIPQLRTGLGVLALFLLILLFTVPGIHIPESYVRIVADSIEQADSTEFIQSGRFTTVTADGSTVRISTGVVSDKSKIDGVYETDDVEIKIDRTADRNLVATARRATISPATSTIELRGEAVVQTDNEVKVMSEKFTFAFDQLHIASNSVVKLEIPGAEGVAGCMKIDVTDGQATTYVADLIRLSCGATITFSPG